jgi:hypothetical protein
MTRPRNIGLILHNGEVVPGVRLPGEPILDRLTYDRVVALYASRRPGGPPSGRYLLSGLAACPCGAKLSGRPVSGTPRRQYWCKACRHTFVDARQLDTWAGDFAIRTLADPAHADAVDRAERELSAQRERLTAEQAGIEVTLTEIAGRLGRQEISLARHDAITRPLDARLAAIALEQAGLAATEQPALTGRTLPARDVSWLGWLEAWDEGTVAERRALVVRALGGRRLTVGPGKAARFDSERVTVA